MMNDFFSGTCSTEVPFSLVVATGCVTLALVSALTFVKTNRRASSDSKRVEAGREEVETPLDKKKYPGGEIYIYYGTQTGTAESFARQLEREGAEHGFFIHVVDLEDIQFEHLVEKSKKDSNMGIAKALFLTSTYGEGEPPDNTIDFVARLKEMAKMEVIFGERTDVDSDPPEKALVGLEYGVFGLGNREYEHYNAIGKFLDCALERTGGKRVVELGLGDDGQDLEGDFENWKDTTLWPTLKKVYINDVATLDRLRHAAKGEGLPTCVYDIKYHTNPQEPMDTPLEKIHGSSRHYFSAVDCPVSVIRELRSKGDMGSTVHIELDISRASDLVYETADNVGVLPVNQPEVVEAVAKCLGFDLDKIFSLKNAENHEWRGSPFPMPISVRECLSRYCDLTLAPRRSDLKLLSAYARDPTDKKVLLRMASKEGQVEYREKVLDDHLGLADVLRMCPSIEATLEQFLTFCPLLQTRFYTISSSSSLHPNSIHITVAVTEATRKDGSVFKGVCSGYLAGLKAGDNVRVYIRSSTFRLPKDPNKPILMVGPGTGVAPFRGMLQERSYQKTQQKVAVGRSTLYFGCKKRSVDFLYEDELCGFQKCGILTHLHLAFSREQKDKVYVQNLLAKNAKDTWSLMNDQGGYIYVCGGVKMGNDVMEAFKQIVCKEGNMSAGSAKELLKKLSDEGRYVQELWA